MSQPDSNLAHLVSEHEGLETLHSLLSQHVFQQVFRKVWRVMLGLFVLARRWSWGTRYMDHFQTFVG